MNKTLGSLLVALLLLATTAGCGEEPRPTGGAADGTERITSSDERLSVAKGSWTEHESSGTVALTLQDAEDTSRQLIVSPFDTAAEAENQAIYLATGLAGQDIVCERTELGGRIAMDCPFSADGTDYRKVLVVLEHDTAAVALFQTAASSRREAFAALEAILDGGRWKDGAPL
ncbi:hypothetical protein GL325_00460 [Aeromicrobium sp. 636]|uniref:DUF1795 domain-containing protein n=1 Tax=Aeromicrobium senzhongii TaxID=2663859 RepID=A0A8I0ETK1_9ACTN|nr:MULTISPECIES: hypothetical protein [Aeromicrobium]MBC9224780.1 hypothetical protein [Aeromicrobium senzhongii]MCQ3996893.1 hypothetical protein [Aeromicrobium sp. 636]